MSSLLRLPGKPACTVRLPEELVCLVRLLEEGARVGCLQSQPARLACFGLVTSAVLYTQLMMMIFSFSLFIQFGFLSFCFHRTRFAFRFGLLRCISSSSCSPRNLSNVPIWLQLKTVVEAANDPGRGRC